MTTLREARRYVLDRALMCGRLTQTNPADVFRELEQALGLRFDAGAAAPDLHRPRFNVPPSSLVPVILAREGELVLTAARWGLVRQKGGLLSNSRSDSLHTPRAALLLRSQRALVVASGFFEWPKHGPKIPHYFTAQRAMCFASLFDVESIGGVDTLCVSIITRMPYERVMKVHPRSPAVIEASHAPTWLDQEADLATVRAQLDVLPDFSTWRDWDCSRRVNDVKNDDPACLDPYVAVQLSLV